MAATTLTSRGQVTIPARVRASLGLKAGSRVEFVEVRQGRYEMVPSTLPVQSLKGLLPKPKQPVSIDDMNAAIAARGR